MNSTSLLQIRIDTHLKEDVSKIFEELGIDISSAVRMFLKRVVLENGIPFRMTIPKYPYKAERGLRALLQLQEEAQKNGTSNMSLEEINAEINASRRERESQL